MSNKSTAKGGKSEHDVGILLARIDEQNEQLTRLQSKFRGITFIPVYLLKYLVFS